MVAGLRRTPIVLAALCALAAFGCRMERVTLPATGSTLFDLASEDLGVLEDVDRGARAGGTQSITGHGNLTIDGELRTFSFNAIRDQQGFVRGEWELHSRATDVRMHGRVTCFFAFPRPGDPARGAAFLGGVVTQSDAENFPVGTLVAFNAFDNGEGANALFPDFITLVRSASPLFVERNCSVGLRIEPVFPIEGGNIQIRL